MAIMHGSPQRVTWGGFAAQVEMRSADRRHLHRAHETRAELERSQIKKSNLIAASPYAASTSPHIIDIKGDGVVGSPSLGPSMVSSRT